MFKTLVLTALMVCSAVADLKNYTDIDALLLAQEYQVNATQQMEPSRELYEEYHRGLTLIRKQVPHMADIHFTPIVESGKIICKSNTIDLEKLNSSYLGPIRVEDIGNKEHLISFPQLFYYTYLGLHLETQFVLDKATELPKCRGVRQVGSNTDIAINGNYYHFLEKSVDCFNECHVTHYYWFKILGNNVTLIKDWIKDDRVDDHHGNSTTIKPELVF